MENYSDDKTNYLFVKKEKDGKLSEHIFIHMGDSDNSSFLAHFLSYNDDMPSAVYRLVKMECSEKLENATSLLKGVSEEQTWKRIRVGASLPSKWRMFFEDLENNFKDEH